jgi:hypothetical protein
VADAVQEFLTDWLIRRNFIEAQAFLAADVLPCIADSLDLEPNLPAERLRQASLRLLERAAKDWGTPRSLTEAMDPVIPWSPMTRIVKHANEQDFTIIEAPTELGVQYECGATPPRQFTPGAPPQYGVYYGAVLRVVQEGQRGGTVVLVWRRIEGVWRLVAYRTVE